MKIPFHRPFITDEEIAEVNDSLQSGWLTMGPKTLRFEEEFQRYIGAKYSIAVNSCTSALHLALKAIDLQPGDEVIVPSMTFTATGEVVCYFNARPVIVDVDRDTLNVNAETIENSITGKTRAIIPVHYAGQSCQMDEIIALAKKKNLYIIEDAAHAIPSRYKGKLIGSIGDLTCFSFYATKTLSTGEGGMITTENAEWVERLKILRLHGISKDAWKRYSSEGSWSYDVVEAGFKYNMTDIQAGLGLAQLKKIDTMTEMRERIANKYSNAFSNNDLITTPIVREENESSWHLYVIKLNVDSLLIDRMAFIEELAKTGIGVSVHFIPLHRHPFYRNTFAYERKDFPNAEWVFERIVSLPIYPGMKDEEVNYVIDAVIDIAERNRR